MRCFSCLSFSPFVLYGSAQIRQIGSWNSSLLAKPRNYFPAQKCKCKRRRHSIIYRRKVLLALMLSPAWQKAEKHASETSSADPEISRFHWRCLTCAAWNAVRTWSIHVNEIHRQHGRWRAEASPLKDRHQKGQGRVMLPLQVLSPTDTHLWRKPGFLKSHSPTGHFVLLPHCLRAGLDFIWIKLI